MFSPDTSFDSPLVFDIGKIMEFNEGFYDILTSTFLERLMELPIAGSYRVTTERFRPDLIAYRIYGEEQFKTVLMLYNNLTSYLEVLPGITLLYPSFRDMESIMLENKVR